MNAENPTPQAAPEITIVADARQGELGEIERAVNAVVHTWWDEFGLEGEPRLTVEARPGVRVGVLVAGAPLHLSAWRWEQAVSVALGERRSMQSRQALSAPDWATQVWAEREAIRSTLAAEVTDSMLRAGSEEVLSSAGIVLPLLGPSAQTAFSSVAIELPSALARALTDLPKTDIEAEVAWLIPALAGRYGVNPPGVSLAISDRDAPVVRLRYGGRATPPMLLSSAEPKSLLAEVFQLAELETPLHLGIWVPDEPNPWATGLYDLPATADRVAKYLPSVCRRLVDEQATVMNEQQVVEAILRVLAAQPSSDGPGTELDATLLDAMEDRARLILGQAVLAHFTQEVSVELIEVGDLPVAGRTRAEIREDVFARRPDLVGLIEYGVLLVPGPIRRAVALAMRPMADTFRVASIDELLPSEPLKQRWAAIHAQESARQQVSG